VRLVYRAALNPGRVVQEGPRNRIRPSADFAFARREPVSDRPAICTGVWITALLIAGLGGIAALRAGSVGQAPLAPLQNAGSWQSGLMQATYNRSACACTSGPRVRIPPAPPICYDALMVKGKRVQVNKEKFDKLLSQLIKTEPVPMRKVKTNGNRGAKRPLFPNPSKS
jgi:hypothetical protein